MRGRTGGDQGAILLIVLFTASALLLMALAGSMLAALHLQSASYAERTGRARVVARSGVQLADAVLARRFRTEGRLPEAAPPLPEGHDLDLRILDYRVLDERSAEIEIEGRRDGAVATAGARLVYP